MALIALRQRVAKARPSFADSPFLRRGPSDVVSDRDRPRFKEAGHAAMSRSGSIDDLGAELVGDPRYIHWAALHGVAIPSEVALIVQPVDEVPGERRVEIERGREVLGGWLAARVHLGDELA